MRNTNVDNPRMIGHTLKTIRTNQGVTMEKIAQEAGLSQSFISKLEAGKSPVKDEHLKAYADVLGMTVQEIYLVAGNPDDLESVNATGLLNTIKDRHNWGIKELSRRLDTSGTNVARWLLGQATPRGASLQVIRQLAIDEGLIVERGNKVYSNIPISKNVEQFAQVVGKVQAGHFLDYDDGSVDTPGEKFVPAAPDPKFPYLQPIAFEVVGDSINELCEDGGHAIAYRFPDTGVDIHHGMIVVAERDRAGLREITIKELRQTRSGWELHPRSTNPIYKPIVFSADEGEEVEVKIVALVRRFVSRPLDW